ncbi:hypothetical protein RB601_009132 [Gaeumannomyces tritici]
MLSLGLVDVGIKERAQVKQQFQPALSSFPIKNPVPLLVHRTMALYNSSSSSLSSTSQFSSPTASPRDSTTTMTRSPSAEPSKPTKRKGTRSVSTLTPSQLARKRANDREAQRAIRARTKEHIERLEREVEELKSKQNRDETLQELIRKNKALEKELMRLRESYGIPTSHPYPTPLYDDSGVSSRASSSFGQHSPDYHQVGDPASSGTAEEYGYIPTSVPSRLEGLPPTSRVGSADMKYEDMDNENGYPRANPVQLPPTYMHQQSWNMYPVYYPQSPAL